MFLINLTFVFREVWLAQHRNIVSDVNLQIVFRDSAEADFVSASRFLDIKNSWTRTQFDSRLCLGVETGFGWGQGEIVISGSVCGDPNDPSSQTAAVLNMF